MFEGVVPVSQGFCTAVLHNLTQSEFIGYALFALEARGLCVCM